MAAPAHRPARRDRVPLLSFTTWGTLRFGRRCRTWRKRPRGLRATLARKGSQSKSSPTRLQTDSQTMSRRGSQTRPDDEFISLNDRAGMANFYRADLFISIHSNSARGWAEGTETFIHPSARGSRSERMARLIEQEYVKAGRESRGVKTANFAVLRNTRMPAVLTEIGFISNRSEERFMNSRKGQKRLARSISNAFIRYRRSVP